MRYCEAHSYRHEIVSGCPRCLDNKRCLRIGQLVMDAEVKDAEIAALKARNAELVEALEELLKLGAHDGPCTNECDCALDDGERCCVDHGACDIHLEASARRKDQARSVLAKVTEAKQ